MVGDVLDIIIRTFEVAYSYAGSFAKIEVITYFGLLHLFATDLIYTKCVGYTFQIEIKYGNFQ